MQPGYRLKIPKKTKKKQQYNKNWLNLTGQRYKWAAALEVLHVCIQAQPARFVFGQIKSLKVSAERPVSGGDVNHLWSGDFALA